MNIINTILSLPEFREKPPILLDIGASGFLHPDWKQIAKYSIYIGIDADNRELDYIPKVKSQFLQFHTINKIVAEKDGHSKFYLTRSPQCSSTLIPDHASLNEWSFGKIFEVDKIFTEETVSLQTILKQQSLYYIDWFKTDSQGTDLRLLKSIGSKIINGLMIAELEPGIMDAYKNEDKMHTIMSFMENYSFWLSELRIKGPQRIRPGTLEQYFSKTEQKFFPFLQKSAAFWGEMVYINTFENTELLSQRDLLLGWVFSTIKQQHSFALEIAQIGKYHFHAPIFDTLTNSSIRYIKQNYWKLPFYFLQKIFQRLFPQISF